MVSEAKGRGGARREDATTVGPLKEIAPGWPWPILDVLGKEMEHAWKLFKTQGVDPDFARRVTLRTLFSTIDAYAFVLSDRALSVAEHRGIEFSKGTLEVLREGKEITSPNGDKEWQSQFNATSKHIRTAIKAYAKA